MNYNSKNDKIGEVENNYRKTLKLKVKRTTQYQEPQKSGPLEENTLQIDSETFVEESRVPKGKVSFTETINLHKEKLQKRKR